jgi:enoyl-[acyl-carrier protein] reductase III
MKMKYKSCLVTGGTRGIGRAVSIQMVKSGYRSIFINYLQNDTEASKTQNLLTSLGAKCILLKANLADLDAIDGLYTEIKKTCKNLDAFIHCAALNTFKPTIKVKPNQWDLVLNINTRSFLYSVQKCVSMMPAGGSIIALSSLGSQRVIPNYGVMGPAKAALESLVKNLAVELASENIRVNAVCGGIIETESIKQFPNSEELLKVIIERTPAKIIGQPDDIAQAVLFLCGEASRYIYGQVITVDGGLSLL